MKFSKTITVLAAATLLASGLGATQSVSAADKKSSSTSALLSQVQSATTKVNKLNNQVSNKMVAIDQTKADIKSTTAKINSYTGKISKASKEVTARKATMIAQLKSLQKQAGNSVTGNIYADFILNSDNLSDMISRAFTVNKLSSANKEALNSVNQAKQKLASLKKAQQSKKAALVATQASLESDATKLSSLKDDAQSEQSDLQQKVSANQAKLEKLASSKSASSKTVAVAQTALATAGVDNSSSSSNGGSNTSTAPSTSSYRSTGSSYRATTTSHRSSRHTTTSSVSYSSSSSLASAALAYVGVPYRWGGASPSGFDCSGLVYYAGHKVGISLPRTSQAMSTRGHRVSMGSLRAGDLLFWGGVGSAYHVAIYIGGGRYVHAPAPGQNVKVQSLNSFRPSFARRL